MANGSQNFNEIQNQIAYMHGAAAAFDALKQIHNMSVEDRYMLFEGHGLPHIVSEYTPDIVFGILENKEVLLNSRVYIGDTIYREEDDLHAVVTFVYPDTKNLSFDAIITKGPHRGQVLKNTTIQVGHFKKTGEKMEEYNLSREYEKYDWE